MAKSLLLYGRILSPYLARCAIAANAKGLKLDIKLPEGGIEVPPLKWSILRYGFSKEDHDGKKEAFS